MKAKQKSFIANSSKNFSTYRPNSSTKNSRFIRHNINNSLSDFYPPITITMPTQKRQSRMGSQITKEELYEENMHLKDKINKMRKELDEVKTKLFKQGLELNKKEKIIRDCSKENVPEFTHEINLEKAKESSLLTMCNQKYNEIKKQLQKKCQENDILKANIKITQLKEYQIKIDVLKKEMEKLRNLYLNIQANYDKSLKEIKQIQDIKNEFIQQHTIINSLNKKNDDLSNEINYLKQENEFLKNELNKNNNISKKLKINDKKLQICKKQYLKLKKNKENISIKNDDNIRQLKRLKKDLADYKNLYIKQTQQYDNLLHKNSKSNIIGKNILDLKPLQNKNLKLTENNQNEQSARNQSQLYKSLLEEAKIKNKILEKFLLEHDINPEQILKGKGFDGIINLNTNKNLIKLTNKIGKSSTNNSTNTKDATSVLTKENQDASKNLNNTQSNLDNNFMSNQNNNTNTNRNINKSNENNENNTNNENNENNTNNENNDNNINNNDIIDERKIEEGKIDDYIKQGENQEAIKDFEIEENKENNPTTYENQDPMRITPSQNSDFNTQELQLKETQLLALLHTFVKNLEANHATKEILINKIKQISVQFENKEEATKEEFIEPFINLFIESMKVTQSNDIQIINEFFSNFIDDMEGDTNRFFLELMDIFENIVDYTLVENEEEVLNAIAMELHPYKDELKKKLEQYDNSTITFDYLRKIIEELNITLTDDYTEFLIYKMKEKVPEGGSIFDLNYKIILDLLDKSINSNNSYNNNTNKQETKIKEEENESKDNNEEEEMNIQMSNKLSELKQALKDNDTTLDEECKDKVKTIEDENNKKIKGINKDAFFDVMKKYNINIEEKVKEAIFDLFKLDYDTLVKSENELFLLDYDKLCSIL